MLCSNGRGQMKSIRNKLQKERDERTQEAKVTSGLDLLVVLGTVIPRVLELNVLVYWRHLAHFHDFALL